MRQLVRGPKAAALVVLIVAACAGATIAGATPAREHVVPVVNQLRAIPSGGDLYGVVCPSASGCVAVGNDFNHQLLTLSGPASAWTPAHAKQVSLGKAFGGAGTLSRVACATASSCVAIGTDYNDTLVSLHGSPSSWGSAQARSIKFGAAFGGYVLPDAVTCTSSTSCIAVATDGKGQPMQLFGNPASWGSGQASIISLGATFGSGGVLNGITCTSKTQCVAVGADSHGQPLALVGDPSSWTSSQATELTLGSAFDSSGSLTSLSCISATQCTAVGFDGHTLPISITGNPATWSAADVMQLSMPAGSGGRGNLTSVRCTSASSCVAVGLDYQDEPAVVDGNPATWGSSVRVLKLPAALGGMGSLSSVSCASAGSCVAVGVDGNDRPIYFSASPSSWTPARAHELMLTGTAFGAVESFTTSSCTSRTACVVVGEALNSRPFVLRGNPAAWGAAAAHELKLGKNLNNGGSFTTISCVSPASCVAVGRDFNGFPIVVHGNPAAWTGSSPRQLTVSTAMGKGGYLDGVWCASATACVAVGADFKGQPVIVRGNPATWSGGSLRQLTLGAAFGSDGYLASIHCTTVTTCVAVGGDGKAQPIVLHGNPATWHGSSAKQLMLSTALGKGGYFVSVTCVSVISCTAVGRDDKSEPIILTGNPNAWAPRDVLQIRITVEPGTVEGFSSALRSTEGSLGDVSCASTTDCVAVGYDIDGSPIFVSGNPATWSHTPAGHPDATSNLDNGSFDSVACTTGECFVVGVDQQTATGARTAFIAKL